MDKFRGRGHVRNGIRSYSELSQTPGLGAYCPSSGVGIRLSLLVWTSLWLMALSLSLHVEPQLASLSLEAFLLWTLKSPPSNISAMALDSFLCFDCVIFGLFVIAIFFDLAILSCNSLLPKEGPPPPSHRLDTRFSAAL